MTTTAHLHPQAAAHLAAGVDAPGIASMTVAQARAAGLGYLALQRRAPAMAHVEHRFIPGPTADLRQHGTGAHEKKAQYVVHGRRPGSSSPSCGTDSPSYPILLSCPYAGVWWVNSKVLQAPYLLG
jgi:hypothetical protein